MSLPEDVSHIQWVENASLPATPQSSHGLEEQDLDQGTLKFTWKYLQKKDLERTPTQTSNTEMHETTPSRMLNRLFPGLQMTKEDPKNAQKSIKEKEEIQALQLQLAELSNQVSQLKQTNLKLEKEKTDLSKKDSSLKSQMASCHYCSYISDCI